MCSTRALRCAVVNWMEPLSRMMFKMVSTSRVSNVFINASSVGRSPARASWKISSMAIKSSSWMFDESSFHCSTRSGSTNASYRLPPFSSRARTASSRLTMWSPLYQTNILESSILKRLESIKLFVYFSSVENAVSIAINDNNFHSISVQLSVIC